MGSTLPCINYTYACGDAIAYRKWFVSLEIFAALLVFFLTFVPYFEKLEHKKERGALYAIYGILAATPLVLQEFIGKEGEIMLCPWSLFIIGGLVYLLGVTFFMTKVPERCKPGCFDYFGSSH